MSFEDEVAELRARIEALEAIVYRVAPPPSKPASLSGFIALEPVVLTVGHPQSQVETPTGLVEAADGAGVATFDLRRLRLDPVPPPDRRLLRGRGQRSARVIDRPLADFQ